MKTTSRLYIAGSIALAIGIGCLNGTGYGWVFLGAALMFGAFVAAVANG